MLKPLVLRLSKDELTGKFDRSGMVRDPHHDRKRNETHNLFGEKSR